MNTHALGDLRFLQLDVFTDRPGGGNPLGVVLGADHWHSADFQAFATWTNLVETTFLLHPTEPSANYRVRIFTPSREIAFAGHPSLGTAHAALETGFVDVTAESLIQQCAAGLLAVEIDHTRAQRELSVQAPTARVVSQGAAASSALRDILGDVQLGALGAAMIEGGRKWWLAELVDEATLRAWRPDHTAIGSLARATDTLGLCAFARSDSGEHDVAVRAFPCGVGILEDPASGAANGLIAAYIAQAEAQGPLARGYCVSQGREIGRDAKLRIRIDPDQSVWVGGCTQTIVDGRLNWRVT
ncbi:MAG: PhzF family phenazine biosynthesis protein [Rhodanobacteraceae bacterium]|nr:PhzF family phenazine biosynthesis protein [Rhodanobacteraceae bacterium]MBP9155004.1 PhzF family phenazine biosynthesis protein [Xanthomonadales bacterium]